MTVFSSQCHVCSPCFDVICVEAHLYNETAEVEGVDSLSAAGRKVFVCVVSKVHIFFKAPLTLKESEVGL